MLLSADNRPHSIVPGRALLWKFLRWGRLLRALHIYSQDQPTQAHVAINWRRADSNLAEALGRRSADGEPGPRGKRGETCRWVGFGVWGRRRYIGDALFSGQMWCLYHDRRHWMKASFGERPEKLQPTVKNHGSELLLQREGDIQPSSSPAVVPGSDAAAAFGSRSKRRFLPLPRTVNSETLKLDPAKLCV